MKNPWYNNILFLNNTSRILNVPVNVLKYLNGLELNVKNLYDLINTFMIFYA